MVHKKLNIFTLMAWIIKSAQKNNFSIAILDLDFSWMGP